MERVGYGAAVRQGLCLVSGVGSGGFWECGAPSGYWGGGEGGGV